MKFNQMSPDIDDVPKCGIIAPSKPHLICVFLLDTSCVMTGEAINNLNSAINDFAKKMTNDEHLGKVMDIAILEFNHTARVLQDFVPICRMPPITLDISARGSSISDGINLAIDKIRERHRLYNELGVPHYTPSIYMITNRLPIEDISAAKQRITEEESKHRLKFWLIGGPKCDPEKLIAVTRRGLTLDDADFSKLFNSLASCIGGWREHPEPALPNNLHPLPQDWDW